jgi:class 3 adenylate cyclase
MAEFTKHSFLPEPDSIQRACSEYRIIPADQDDVAWAAKLAENVYAGIDVIPPEVMVDWFIANPNGFSVFKRSGRTVGNLDILPVKPNSLTRLVSGSLLERDLTGDSIYRPEERHLIDALYIESLVIDPEMAIAGPRLILELLLNFGRIINRICVPAQIRALYAISASEEGTGLLTRLGFEPVGSAANRRDAHQLYLGNLAAVSDRIRSLISREPSDDVHSEASVNIQDQSQSAPADSIRGLKPETGCVLMMDIVGFTKLSPHGQLMARKDIERAVRKSESANLARKKQTVIIRSTGDNLALVFFEHPSTVAACAMEVTHTLRLSSGPGVRMGINQGTVYRLKDINDTDDVNGSGINMAQRIMDAGEAGHILTSASVADELLGTVEWHHNVFPLGKLRIKHGGRVEMFSLQGGDFGNPTTPRPNAVTVRPTKNAE